MWLQIVVVTICQSQFARFYICFWRPPCGSPNLLLVPIRSLISLLYVNVNTKIGRYKIETAESYYSSVVACFVWLLLCLDLNKRLVVDLSLAEHLTNRSRPYFPDALMYLNRK